VEGGIQLISQQPRRTSLRLTLQVFPCENALPTWVSQQRCHLPSAWTNQSLWFSVRLKS
jgi:hypothetical protein